jgi:hypothetical protein
MYVYRYLIEPKNIYLYGLTKHGRYQMHEIPTFTCFDFTQPQMVIKHLFLSYLFFSLVQRLPLHCFRGVHSSAIP